MLERFKQLLGEMNRGIYEKETEISLSLLAALAGESIILLGPPGVAKYGGQTVEDGIQGDSEL